MATGTTTSPIERASHRDEPAEHHSHRAPEPGPWMRWRALYARLPTGAQMIGLQLWLPVFFVFCFCFCYLAAFHAPTPRQVPVAVVGPSAVTQPVAAGLAKATGQTFALSTTDSLAEARQRVRTGELAAAYVPATTSGGRSTVVVASAAQFQLAAVAKQTFLPVAGAAGSTLSIDDVAPLPSWDTYGTSLFYLTLACTIGGYMVAMFVGMMGGALSHVFRGAILVVGGAVISALVNLLAGPAIGAVHGHFAAMFGIGWAGVVAVGLVVNGMAYFLGRFVTGAALLVFVFANIPSSGGAYPPEFVPQPFHWLHHIASGRAMIDLFRHVVYGVGPAPRTAWYILAGYALVGIVLSLLGKLWHDHRQRRRTEKGKPPSMMVAAQMTAMAAGSASDDEPDPGDGDPDDRPNRYAESEADGDAAAAVSGAVAGGE